MSSNKFICHLCDSEFNRGCTEAEALIEVQKIDPTATLADCLPCCEECIVNIQMMEDDMAEDDAVDVDFYDEPYLVSTAAPDNNPFNSTTIH